ncbi:hypothetical protein, partial [Winogradskyella ouciana]|uniref:hypothetical protein n=1 Tax=Winogradskyella ouciana TaxID=2608631 RepID=UPI001F2FB220
RMALPCAMIFDAARPRAPDWRGRATLRRKHEFCPFFLLFFFQFFLSYHLFFPKLSIFIKLAHLFSL